jgi:hypothetical protein
VRCEVIVEALPQVWIREASAVLVLLEFGFVFGQRGRALEEHLDVFARVVELVRCPKAQLESLFELLPVTTVRVLTLAQFLKSRCSPDCGIFLEITKAGGNPLPRIGFLLASAGERTQLRLLHCPDCIRGEETARIWPSVALERLGWFVHRGEDRGHRLCNRLRLLKLLRQRH